MNFLILLLNIVGTFLVSVEAIKLENLQKLAEFLRKTNSSLNPQIEWVDDSDQAKSDGLGYFFFIILVLFSPISFIITYHWLKLLVNIYWIIGISFFGTFVIWTALIYFTGFIISLLRSIEKYTSKGIIGILGFLILFVSFMLQYYAT